MEDKHRRFLNALRESCATNMFGAVPHLMAAFEIEKREAKAILIEWMTFFRNDEPDEPDEEVGE